MHAAVFFITTARSGTQWVAAALAHLFDHSLVVAHEPVGYAYRPKVYLRAYDRLEQLRAEPQVAKHLDESIESCRRHRMWRSDSRASPWLLFY